MPVVWTIEMVVCVVGMLFLAKQAQGWKQGLTLSEIARQPVTLR